jgi:hypothetical protein
MEAGLSRVQQSIGNTRQGWPLPYHRSTSPIDEPDPDGCAPEVSAPSSGVSAASRSIGSTVTNSRSAIVRCRGASSKLDRATLEA